MKARLILATTIALVAASILPVASASGEVLYGADGAGGRPADLLVVDPTTGNAVERIGPIGFSVTGLAEDPTTGVLYGVTGGNDVTNPGFLLTINERTGTGSLIGDLFPADTTPSNDIAFRSDGQLFGWDTSDDDLLSINKSTGAATVVGDSGLGTFGNGLAFSPAGTLFAALEGADDPLYTVDPATGAVTAGPTMNGLNNNAVNALAFDSAGTLFGVISNFGGADGFGKLMTINTTTGELGFRTGAVQALDALEFVDSQARTIGLKAKKKVKAGKKVKLRGAITSPVADCVATQAVEIQRQEAGVFETIATVISDASGAYSNKQKVEEKTKFRTQVTGAPAFCADAISPVKKVKIKKEKQK